MERTINLAIKRNDGKTPNPRIATGEIKFMTKAINYEPDGGYILVQPDMVEKFVDALCSADIVACDTETTGLDWKKEHIIGMSFAVPKGTTAMEKLYPGAKAFYFNIRELFEAFARFFMNRKPKIFHNAKFDLHMLMNDGLIDMETISATEIIDTMLMSYLNNENESHALKALSSKYLDPDADRLEKLLKEFMKANNCTSYEQVPLDLLTDYAAADTYYTLELYNFLNPKLEEQNMLTPIADLFNRQGSLLDIENALMKELMFQERLGVQIDIPFTKEYVDDLEKNLPIFEAKIVELAGAVNVRSTEELYQKLITMGAHPSKFELTAKEKKPKVDDACMERLIRDYKNDPAFADMLEFIDAVQELKDSEKQLNTYLKNFIDMCDKLDRLHTQFNQHIARTGRLSSSEPNVQNIPKIYKKLRACFMCMAGWNIAFFDYSQIEMRLFADYSNDPVMLKAVRDGKDLHGETAREVYGILEEVWNKMALTDEKEYDPSYGVTEEEWNKMYAEYKDKRQKGKTVNFGVVYGMGKKKTSDKLGLTKLEPIFETKLIDGKWQQVKVGEEPNYREGMMFLNRYYEKFIGVQTLMNQSKQVINARGYIRNRFNRRRRLEKQESYKAVNALIQGCAADIIKVAMIKVGSFLRDGGYRSRMVNNIHDEIWVEIPDDELFLIPKIKKLMEVWTVPAFKVPILCDVEISNTNWREKHHLSKDHRPEVITIGEQIARGDY